jgi:hypothetical protein
MSSITNARSLGELHVLLESNGFKIFNEPMQGLENQRFKRPFKIVTIENERNEWVDQS